MNRKRANSLDSEDSDSDWDTTVAESQAHDEIPKVLPPTQFAKSNDNAKVLPKSQFGHEGVKALNPSGHVSRKSATDSIDREISQIKVGSQLISPPPHMNSFQSALSDYMIIHDTSPDLPPRGYEGKGKLYTVPESDTFVSPQTNLGNWDDSDADERVLKELQRNLMKDKQRHQTLSRDRKVTLSVDNIIEKPDDVIGKVQNGTLETSASKESSSTKSVSVENHGYVASPKEARSNESVIEKWSRANEMLYGKSTDKSQKCITTIGDIGSISSQYRPPSRTGVITPPLIAKVPTGKKCVFYFEEGNLHFVEVEEDDVNAYLPRKVDEMEKIFRRVWREVFAVLRIVTSVFILFIVELILFLAHHVVRPLVLDSITATGNYVLKPLLALSFNAILQPIFALMWNICNALYQVSEPLVKLLGYILTQVAILLKAFRLCVVQWNTQPSGSRQEMEVV